MGYKYTGFDIRQEQIDENVAVLNSLGLTGASYILGDGRFLDPELPKFDFALTCPPYHDLEKYSDQSDDLSNMSSYDEFNGAMFLSALAHAKLMKPGAFVCIVVGPFRNKKTGELIDFPGHTIDNFREAGFIYWQQVVLSKNFASAATRASNAWKGTKLVPSHEFLLVFRQPLNE
jgi:DNA modification methylase